MIKIKPESSHKVVLPTKVFPDEMIMDSVPVEVPKSRKGHEQAIGLQEYILQTIGQDDAKVERKNKLKLAIELGKIHKGTS